MKMADVSYLKDMPIAVLGGGAVGKTMAADCALAGKEVRQKLDEESRELLDAGRHEISGIPGIGQAGRLLKEGLSYDDHLLLMMMCMKPRTRLLRVMDVVQINMKYRYYRDFNLMEYYTGVRYAITADGRNYEFEDHYK